MSNQNGYDIQFDENGAPQKPVAPPAPPQPPQPGSGAYAYPYGQQPGAASGQAAYPPRQGSGYYPTATPTGMFQTPQPMYPDYTQPGGGSGAYGPGGYGAPPAYPSGVTNAYSTQSQQMAYNPAAYAAPGAISQSSSTVMEGRQTPVAGEVSQSRSTMVEGANRDAGEGSGYNVQGLIGRTVDRYKIEKLLGEGGFGAVYRAEHTLMKRPVAFKTLHKELAKDPAVLHRFRKEGQVAARFKHKNAIELYDFGQMEDGTYFMAMEFLSGKDLRDHIKKQGALDLANTFDIMIQALGGLQAAHDGGVIHRDLKPDNIKLEDREGRTNFVKILDFGIAKMKDVAEPEEGQSSGYKTQIGAFFGTPEYGSPEQCAGEEIDGRSDLYTMGVILYECLTGSLPFVSKTPQGYLAQHMVAPPRPIRDIRPDLNIPPEVEAIILKALEKKREDRYQTANEFANAMIDCATKVGIPITVEGGGTVVIKTPTWKIALLVAVPVIAIAVGAWWYIGHQQDAAWDGENGFMTKINRLEAPDRRGYEEALQNIASPGEFKRNHDDELAKLKSKFEELIKNRDARLDNELKAFTREYASVPPEDRDYNKWTDHLDDILKTDSELLGASSWKNKFQALDEQVAKERDAYADAYWARQEEKINKKMDNGDWDGAIEDCKVPAKLSRTHVPSDSKRKIADIETAKSNITDSDRNADKAYEAAEAYRKSNPRKWKQQLAEFTKVLAFRGTRKASDVNANRLKEINNEWLAEGRKALKPLADAEQRAIASGKIEEMSAALTALKGYGDEFKENKELEKEWSNTSQLIQQAANSRLRSALDASDAQLAAFKPEKAIEIMDPWTRFEGDEGIQKIAKARKATLDKVLELHKNMVEIPAADVEIGVTRNDVSDGPIQKKHIDAFAIDPTEVTNAQYLTYLVDAFGVGTGSFDPDQLTAHLPSYWQADANNPRYPDGLETHPVRQVKYSWAEDFAKWAGKRLPTEFEWEYAARGPSAVPQIHGKPAPTRPVYPWGGEVPGKIDEQGAYAQFRAAPGTKTIPVAQLLAGKSKPFGLFDMAGNVQEWTSSFYVQYEGCLFLARNYGVSSRVLRGGGFASGSIQPCRCSGRNGVSLDDAPDDAGFRCVKSR